MRVKQVPRVENLMLEMPKPMWMRTDRREAMEPDLLAALVEEPAKNALLDSLKEAENHLSSGVQAADRHPNGEITENHADSPFN